MSIRYTKIPHVDEERLDDELLLLHPETLQAKILNETAAVFWDALEAFPTAEALASLLREARPELSPAESLAHVNTFLDELEAARFVRRQEPPPE
jgi:hypothetical protein